jgi:hypothetical protein
VQYEIASPIYLTGFTAHGGGYGTSARFFSPQKWLVDAALEWALTRRWVLACDLVALWGTKTHYSGKPGWIAPGKAAILGRKFSAQYSLAPALEYNWNSSLGVIGGGWFTFAGKNALRFWSGVFAINYYW